jgi:tetratricopeptide (TPR) repeat protein
MSWFDRFNDATIDKAIRITAICLAAVLLVGVAYVAYRQWPRKVIPAIIQKQIDAAAAAVAKDPKDADARVKLASLYLDQAMYPQAQTELEAALSSNANHIAALSLLGTIYEHNGQISKAVTYYKKAIDLSNKTEFKSLNPYMYESIYRLGTIYIDQKKYKQAIDLLNSGVQINQMDSDLRYRLGEAYVLSGKADDAIIQLEEALKYVPNFAEAYYWLGRAYELKGNKTQAKVAYQDAVKYKRGYTDAEEALKKLK